MYHQEPTFLVTPLPVQDDRESRNLHRLTLPQWLYVRFPGTLNPREDLAHALQTLLGAVLLCPASLRLARPLSDEECTQLRDLAETFGCELKVTQRSDAQHLSERQRAYATRTGTTHGGPR